MKLKYYYYEILNLKLNDKLCAIINQTIIIVRIKDVDQNPRSRLKFDGNDIPIRDIQLRIDNFASTSRKT